MGASIWCFGRSALFSAGAWVSRPTLWILYGFFISGNPFFTAMTHHEIVLGFLYAFVYFSLVQPVLGTSQRYQTLGQLLWVFIYSGVGGFLCFLLGQFIVRKWGLSLGNGNEFLLWLGVILLGVAVGSKAAQRRGKN